MEKLSRILLSVLFAAGLFVISGYTFFGPQDTVSFYEQRVLAVMPELTLERLWSGAFFSDLETYLADHIALRNTMLKLHTRTEMAMKKVTVNGVAVSGKELLDYNGFSLWGLSEVPEKAAAIAEDYKTLNTRVRSWGGYFCYLGLPLQSSYFAPDYPACLDDRQWHLSVIRETFSKEMEARGVPFLDMYRQYAEEGFPKEYYYETDHHYTMRGAFAAYQALLEKVNRESGFTVEVPEEEELQWTALPNRFLGSANRKLYGLWETSDVLEIAAGKPVPFRRYDQGQPAAASVYSLPEYEWEAAAYNVYMGGDIAETIIQTDRPDLPSVLIYGDSFTNPLETLLWPSFNETRSLDFRYYDKKTLTEYLEEYQPDLVVCVRDETVYLSSDGNGTTGDAER